MEADSYNSEADRGGQESNAHASLCMHPACTKFGHMWTRTAHAMTPCLLALVLHTEPIPLRA